MPDILKVTSPTITHESISRPRPGAPTDTNIPNIPNAERVTAPNAQNVYTERQPNKFSRGMESNYDNFLQLMRLFPDVGQAYKEIFFARMGFLVNAGIDEHFAEEISQYMQLLKMTDSELLAFLKSQFDTSTKFNDPIFNIFREVYNTTKSDGLKTTILDMLRKFDGMTAENHIINEILSNLKGIARQMPNVSAQEITQMAGRLLTDRPQGGNAAVNSANDGNFTANLNVLKNEIIPYLSKYMSITHDYGEVRDLITMFTLNLARYEYCSKESLMKSLSDAMSFEDFAGKISPDILKNINMLFTRAGNYDITNTGNLNNANKLIETLVNIISRGMDSKSPQNQAVFTNIMQSMLTNESVYMPLLHIMIPADIGGQMFFSEIWADPDAENDSQSANGAERSVKLLIKFDIKNVGFFEMIISAKDTSVDLQLFYPESFTKMEGRIKAGINEIAQRNGLTLSSFTLDKMTAPKAISEVFPKIYERKNAVNVVV